MGGHADVRRPARQAIDHRQEPRAHVEVGGPRIGPLPFHHPHPHPQIHCQIRIADAAAPAAGQGAAEPRMPRETLGDQREGGIACLRSQRIEVDGQPAPPGDLQDLREQIAGESERRGFHRQRAIQTLPRQAREHAQVFVCDGAGAVVVSVPVADRAGKALLR